MKGLRPLLVRRVSQIGKVDLVSFAFYSGFTFLSVMGLMVRKDEIA